MLLKELDVFKIAVSIEEAGMVFYGAAAEAVENEEIRGVFTALKGAEIKHRETFLRMRNEDASVRPHFGFRQAPEVDAYVRELIRTNVFGSPSAARLLAREKTLPEALELGIRAERDAILFYSALKEVAEGADIQSLLDRLIAEERKHLIILSEIRVKHARR